MNTRLDPPSLRWSAVKNRNERGIALVIVLAMLMLLTGLLVAFMSTATTELSATQAASAGNVAKNLSDTTLNMVIGQLREATTQPDERTTWASQPGAIRTFSGQLTSTKKTINSQGAFYYDYQAGSNDYVFKLYSSARMKVSSNDYSSQDLPEEVEVIENWENDKPEGYVDVNEPMVQPRFDLDSSGKIVESHYPIIDPRAMYTPGGSRTVSGSNPGLVEGFDAKLSFDEDRVLAGTQEPVPYLPMPVKWLYVLKDSSVGSEELATEENPIIGRIAFWVDDETCKLNINTSSEGTFWDTPSAGTEQEAGDVSADRTLTSSRFSLSLATASPASGEFQRYPGHPMTTCLSPVLGQMWGLTPAMSLYPRDNPNYTQFKEAIYKISPFTPNGRYTTRGATFNAEKEMPADNARPKQEVDTKRLYANVDELIFTSARNSGGANPTTELNDFNDKFTPEALEKTRFFLSAHSRAPELNVFGRPRVTIWPIHTNFKHRTQFDDLFAFASTMAETGDESRDLKFYVTRGNAKSQRADFEGEIGTGGKTQNQQMYEYLQALSERAIPGFGNSLRSKYPNSESRDQILTEIFDYSRTVNLVDTGTSSKASNVFIPYTPRFYPEGVDQVYSRKSRAIDWSGQVVPLRIKKTNSLYDTMGMGRFFVISEAALVFYRLRGSPSPAQDKLQGVLLLEMSTTMPGFPGIKETFWTRIYPMKFQPNDTEKNMFISLGSGTPVDAEFCTQESSVDDPGLINVVNVGSHEVGQGRAFMPTLGFQSMLCYYTPHYGQTYPERYVRPEIDDPKFRQTGTQNPALKTFNWPNYGGTPGVTVDKTNIGFANFNWDTTVRNYPYVTKPIPIGGATTFRFSETALRLEIWSGQDPRDRENEDGSNPQGRSKLVQIVELEFPQITANLPMPTSYGPISSRYDGTLDNGDKGSGRNIIDAGDVVRSIEFTGPVRNAQNPWPLNSRGDLRIAAALHKIPRSFYTPRNNGYNTPEQYDTPTRIMHGLTTGHGDPQNNGHTGKAGGPHGKLMTNGSAPRGDKPAILPRGINGVKRFPDGGPGDWDRGLSKHMDGAFGNKVDEGNLKFDMGASGSSRLPYYRGRGIEETGQTFFSPNRQLPSAVMLGSLPSGINPVSPEASQPWQTLLFRPDRESGNVTHPGAGVGSKPADHLWLDLFHVPIVEPYAISEPFSTAGKVNMNYVIAPFGYAKGESGSLPNMTSGRSYLRRDTALRGVLRSTWMMAVPTAETENGHTEAAQAGRYFRWPIDLDKTIEEMELRLNDQRQGLASRSTTLFRATSEICDIDLYPKRTASVPGTPTVSNWNTFWNTQYAATGDNMRERPYAHIYPRLTTRSNTYTVHMRCQAIRKAPGTKPNEFDQKRDQIASEYRGSATIERFIDPNDPDLRDYNVLTEKADPYYRFRVVATKHFSGN